MPRVEKEVTIMNPQGLHARPAALFVQIASKYEVNVTLKKDGETVNGKSIMGVLMLGAEYQSKITLTVEGEEAEVVINELIEFLQKNE